MKILKNNFNRKYLHIFLTIWVLFTIATFAILCIGLDGQKKYIYTILTTAATFTGPMTGAVARQGQVCCTEFSLKIMMFCAPVLLFGTIFQLINIPLKKYAEEIRLLIWIVCLMIWFLGGIISFGHALA